MKVTVTGATGLIGSKLVGALQARGDDVTVLSRSPEKARGALGDVEAHEWDPIRDPAPAAALAGRDGVVHLAGEALAQRWSDDVKRRILESRDTGTRNLVAGIEAAEPRPGVLVSSSAVGFYGPHGDERVDESDPAGDDFAATVCVAWENAAEAASKLGLRVVKVRTGVVLAEDGGALAQMLTPFKLGVGGPVAGGEQYMPWVHLDDVVGMYLEALDDTTWSGPVNATAPEPVTNKVFSKALGKALHRPAVLPVPELALKALYGEMAQIVVTGQRAVPKRAGELGYEHRHPELAEALSSALGN
jgi:uncharacterized protein (TIGR01777 family)